MGTNLELCYRFPKLFPLKLTRPAPIYLESFLSPAATGSLSPVKPSISKHCQTRGNQVSNTEIESHYHGNSI
ncbi:TPA: hypothetical protein DHW51_20495 [Candidatus Poribacteria bacterium]|nr:hypothetical protein [Candidatus Poribacteria bacterium]